MKRIITLTMLLLLSCSQITYAQKFPAMTNEAIAKYKEKDFEAARTLIDQSVKSIEGKDHAYTWHLKGHIYKHFFSLGIDPDIDASNRDIAIQSFIKSIELDTEKTFYKANIDGLKPLANSYWNEAVAVVNQGDKNSIVNAKKYFIQFIETRKMIGLTENLNQYQIDFYKAYASANAKYIDAERDQNHDRESSYQDSFEEVEQSYKKILDINKEEYTANYNLSITLYNEGAFQIEQMPEDADLGDIFRLQEGAVEIFRQALPYALKADNIRPGRIETVKVLRAIYLALNDYDQFDFFDQMVKKIKSDSNMMSPIDKKKFQEMRKDSKSYKMVPELKVD